MNGKHGFEFIGIVAFDLLMCKLVPESAGGLVLLCAAALVARGSNGVPCQTLRQMILTMSTQRTGAAEDKKRVSASTCLLALRRSTCA